jgi:hypothetical protein
MPDLNEFFTLYNHFTITSPLALEPYRCDHRGG